MLLGSLFLLQGCHKKETTQVPKSTGEVRAPGPSGLEPAIDDGSISILCQAQRVPVIMYHDVIPVRNRTSVFFDITVRRFLKQMQFIQQNHMVPITLDQLYDHLTKGSMLPPNAICLTFDDNYLGFFQNAYPILKEFNYPCAMFVHTNYIGDERGSHPKMGWAQLHQLVADGLVTIGAHTESHPLPSPQLPNGFASLTENQQFKELSGSKAILEKTLGIKVNYMAWPDGNFSPLSEKICRQCGYKMAFAMQSGLAEESNDIYSIYRYPWEKFEKAWAEDQNVTQNAPAAVAETQWTIKPVELHVKVSLGLKIAYLTGGTPQTLLSNSRKGVLDFVRESGAAGGVNGGFFAMASLYSKSNIMIGPSYTSNRMVFSSGLNGGPIERLRERPVLFWGPKEAIICNFQPGSMITETPYRNVMPDFNNLFVAGAWMIHDGQPLTNEQMLTFASKDLADPRRRVFFGWTNDGVPIAGASLQTCTTERLAEAAAAVGVKEAVLLDSGFSTSVVFDDKVIVTGHTAKDLPSRPVPHAIVFMGTPDYTDIASKLKSAAEGAIDPADIYGAQEAAHKRHERRLRHLYPSKSIRENGVRIDLPPSKDKKIAKNGINSKETDSSGGSTGSVDQTDSGSLYIKRHSREKTQTFGPGYK